MVPRRSLSPTLLVSVMVLTGWFATLSVAADSAPASSGRRRPNKNSKSAMTQPSGAKRIGVVQAALRQLYTIPRTGPRQLARKTKPGASGSAPETKRRTRQESIAPGAPGSPATSNRLGLQHLDAIRNSVSSLPIGDDIHGAQADRPDEPKTGSQEPEQAATNVYVGVPPVYHRGQRLSPHERSWTDYRYYGGRPSRYGRGRYSRYSDDIYDGYGSGESFRFGFMEGYDAGYFDRTTSERVESVMAHASAYLDRGIELFREGRYLEAADAFQVASDMDQGSAASRIYAGHALFALGRYRDAVRHIRRAFELQPRIAHLTYDMRGDYDEPMEFKDQYKALQTALRLSPRDPDRLFMTGYILYYSGQRSGAYPFLVRAYKLDKSDRLVAKLMHNAQPSDMELDAQKSNVRD